MKTDLDHLPPQKQRELERVVQLIFEEFDDAFALAKHEWKKAGRILKVILYGSYARGTWVDEPHTAKGYRSDFDLLIIVNDKRLTDRVKYWAKLDDRLMREYGVTGTLKTPVNFIVHTLQEVNDGLAHGRYFFMDVKEDGVALYQFDETELHTPKPKTPVQALAMAQEYFDEWLPTAMGFKRNAGYAVRDGDLKLAAFLMHQTAERLYHCVIRRIITTWPFCARRPSGSTRVSPMSGPAKPSAIAPGSKSSRTPMSKRAIRSTIASPRKSLNGSARRLKSLAASCTKCARNASRS